MRTGTKIKLLLSTLILLTIISITAGTAEAPVFAASGSQKTSFDYKLYDTQDEYRTALKSSMKRVADSISRRMDDGRTIPIPGLIKTYSYSKGVKKASKHFVPQGICRAGQFWLVTAYDSEKECNTVIYAVDPVNQSLVSTVVLPYRYHAGGIAFDGQNIWLTGNTSDKYKGDPFLQYINFDDFCGMVKDSFYRLKKNELSAPVYIKNKPSFLEYDDGIMWVGTYVGQKNSKESYMYGYRMIGDGTAVKLNTITTMVMSGIDSSAQGADIDGNYMYVSSSYNSALGPFKTSFVTKYNIRPVKEGGRSLDCSGREKKRVEVPKMNEEILVEDGCVFVNFESAAEKYKMAAVNTDRILALDLALWE